MKIKIAPGIVIMVLVVGCQGNFYSEKDFPALLKIDSHVHLNSDKGYFENQAAKDNFLLITLNVDISDSVLVKKQHEFAIFSTKKYLGKVFYSATFCFDTIGWGTNDWSKKVISHLADNISDGAVSVKLWKNIGMSLKDKNGRFIMIDDPGLKPVIEFIISRKLPITGHLGEPRNCWLPLNEMTVRGDSSYYAENPKYHMFLHPEYPSYKDQINARDHLLELYRDLKFIGCHLGSLEWDVDELAKRLDKFPNMAVDMAARICHLQFQSAKNREKVRNFCIKYQERLLYGTDLSDDGTNDGVGLAKYVHETWINDWKYFTTDNEMSSDNFKGKFIGLQLPKEVVRKIYCTNAIRWYKLETRYVDFIR